MKRLSKFLFLIVLMSFVSCRTYEVVDDCVWLPPDDNFRGFYVRTSYLLNGNGDTLYFCVTTSCEGYLTTQKWRYD